MEGWERGEVDVDVNGRRIVGGGTIVGIICAVVVCLNSYSVTFELYEDVCHVYSMLN